MALAIPRDAPRSRLWIVDDSPLEAEVVRRTLSPVYDVEVFCEGASFIEQLASVPPPDAVILDWQMPGISGLEICRFLRSRAATQLLPILVLTVHRDTADLVRCLAAGADDFCSKPYNAAELSARLAALVRTKRMHEQLESAERSLRLMLMQLPEAVISVGANGRVTLVNHEAERMLGEEALGLLGRPLRDILPNFDPDPVDARSDSASGVLPDLTIRDRIFAPAVRRYAGVAATDLTFSFRDVTAERRLADERARLLAAERAARSQAEAANLAKDQFLAVVSHELRTPLNAIVGWTHLLRDGALDEGKRARAIATIERNAVAQQKLVEDILDISRIMSDKMHVALRGVDLGAVLRAAAEAVRPAVESKGLQFTVSVAEPLPPVKGDAQRLQQVAWNLLTNAVKFTPAGGAVALEARLEANVVRIDVRDTGVGIDPGFLPHVFERFRQADSSTTRTQGGLGLGLSIVRSLVELHGGTVSVQSEGAGTGSTFTVRLPASPEDLATGGAATETRAGEATGRRVAGSADALEGLRVLVVDDDRDGREFVAEVLTGHGARVKVAGSVKDAFSKIRSFRPHVVVSDVGMPTEDGYALASQLRAMDDLGCTAAIALTAYASAQDVTQALASGFDAHLGKPLDAGALVRTIASLGARARSEQE